MDISPSPGNNGKDMYGHPRLDHDTFFRKKKSSLVWSYWIRTMRLFLLSRNFIISPETSFQGKIHYSTDLINPGSFSHSLLLREQMEILKAGGSAMGTVNTLMASSFSAMADASGT